MIPVRQSLGGLGNLMFKQAYLMGQMFDGSIPDVYVQSTKYWKPHEEKIKSFYRIGIGPRMDKVALHIRRGDYLNAEHFHTNLWKTSYYQDAIKLFPGKKFLVFCKDNQSLAQDTKDRDWCAEELTKMGIDFEMSPEDNSEVDDLNLMASCAGHIMANSSFSWWAAYLNPHNPMVVCPKKWFEDGVERCELLPEWIKI